MFELLLSIMIVLFLIYIYINEKAIKRGKIPFSNRLNIDEKKKRTVRKGTI